MYSTREASERLSLSKDRVKRLARRGVIRAEKIGRDWVVLSLDYKGKRNSRSIRGGK